MKQALLFCIFTILSFSAFSQCTPNQIYQDSAFGVYPAPDPMGMDLPDQGITESACINSGYEFTLTFKIPETFAGITLDSIVIAQTGAVLNLPEGLSYVCNPGNCVFTSLDTLACLSIVGTATDQNAPGDYNLMIVTDIFTSVISQEITFPTPLVDGGDGEYILTLLENGDPNCTIASVQNDYITKNIRVSNSPNPFSTTTNIEVVSTINEQLDFRVFDILGNLVHYRKVDLMEGENNFEFDGTHLSNGIYSFTLSNNLGAITRKIVVSR